MQQSFFFGSMVNHYSIVTGIFKKRFEKNKLVNKLVLKFYFFFVHRKILQRLEQYGCTCFI